MYRPTTNSLLALISTTGLGLADKPSPATSTLSGSQIIFLEIADLIIEPAYRNRGLGTAVLQYVLGIAQSRGIEVIEGRIVGRDLQVTPHLADWYRRHGFALEEIGPEHPLNKKSSLHSLVHERRRATRSSAAARRSNDLPDYETACF